MRLYLYVLVYESVRAWESSQSGESACRSAGVVYLVMLRELAAFDGGRSAWWALYGALGFMSARTQLCGLQIARAFLFVCQ